MDFVVRHRLMKQLLLTALLLLASSAWAAPIDDAVAAGARGDYAAKLVITRPLFFLRAAQD